MVQSQSELVIWQLFKEGNFDDEMDGRSDNIRHAPVAQTLYFVFGTDGDRGGRSAPTVSKGSR